MVAIVIPVLVGHTARTAVLAARTVEHLTRMMVDRCVAVPTNGKVLNVTNLSTNAMTMAARMIVCLDAKSAGTRLVALYVNASRVGKVTTVEQPLTVVVMKCA